VIDATAALEGARAIRVERFTEDATLIGTLREEVWLRGRLRSRVRAGKAASGAKFADYFEFSEPLANCRRTASLRCSAARRRKCSLWSWCLTDRTGSRRAGHL